MDFDKYFVYPRDLEQIFSEDDTIVVPDTNFLLSAYQWRDLTVNAHIIPVPSFHFNPEGNLR